MKNTLFINVPLLAILIISGCLEYFFTVRFFRILTDWIPTAGIGFLFVGILSFTLAVVSIAEIGLLLSLLSIDVREAFAHRE
ncbi:MAG: hypothetical protein UX89_C0020G0002 [Parcubacteria group bacterium GW2011_GWA2_47_16]|nr:MAG: hypothetical protein UX89_C0020G0002 [Parcubacteria group bacterium GW2011_GWA2_47_16]